MTTDHKTQSGTQPQPVTPSEDSMPPQTRGNRHRSLEFRLGRWTELSSLAGPVRVEVFVQEQGIPAEIEWDAHDLTSLHCVALCDGQAIGTGRLLPDGHIGRMAVLALHRRDGIGGMILSRLIEAARQDGHNGVELSAQTYVSAFYQRFGFQPQGEVYDEVGIPHQKMVLKF